MFTYRRTDDAVSGSINAAIAARHSEVENRLLSLVNVLLHEKQFMAASSRVRGHRVIYDDVDRAYHSVRAALAKVRGEQAIEVDAVIINA
jgi:hypothetical protein